MIFTKTSSNVLFIVKQFPPEMRTKWRKAKDFDENKTEESILSSFWVSGLAPYFPTFCPLFGSWDLHRIFLLCSLFLGLAIFLLCGLFLGLQAFLGPRNLHTVGVLPVYKAASTVPIFPITLKNR